MAEDSSLFVHAQVEPGLVPSLPALVETTAQSFAALAEAVRKRQGERPGKVSSSGIEAAILALDADLAKLRAQRATAPFALDRMLPFWALVFNLREVAQGLKAMESTLPQLA
jgi:hypothetical protein